MTRTIDVATAAVLGDDSIRMAHFLTFEFSSTLRFTDYGHSITYDSNTYAAVNGFIDLSDPSESEDLRVNSLTVQMSGVEQSFISIFLTALWVNRRALLQVAFLDANDAVIGEPVTLFDGLISNFSISETADTSVVDIVVASHWANFERKAGRLTNNNSQQYLFPGDLGMQFSASVVADIKWGKR
jgi:hypothetical protein